MSKRKVLLGAFFVGAVAIATSKALFRKLSEEKALKLVDEDKEKIEIISYILDKHLETEHGYQSITVKNNDLTNLFSIVDSMSDEELSFNIKFELSDGSIVTPDILAYLPRETGEEKHFAQVLKDDEFIKVFIYKDKK